MIGTGQGVNMVLRGVLFDMGGTLLRFRPHHMDWDTLEKEVGQRVYDFLNQHGYRLPPRDESIEIYWRYFQPFWQDPLQWPVGELKLDAQMVVLARLWGLDNPSDETLRGMAQTYMSAMRAYLQPMEGAADTLRALRERGLRVGLISNTIWPDGEHITDLEQHELSRHIECFIFSGDAECWKPGRDIFERGLAALALEPGEAAYVGDSLYFDVWGAQQAGLRGVWIKAEPPSSKDPTIIPDAIIHNLPELLPLVDQWRGEA